MMGAVFFYKKMGVHQSMVVCNLEDKIQVIISDLKINWIWFLNFHSFLYMYTFFITISIINFWITDYNSRFYHLMHTLSSGKKLKNRMLKLWCNVYGSGKGGMTISVISLFLQILTKSCNEIKASINIRCMSNKQHMNLKLETETNACL